MVDLGANLAAQWLVLSIPLLAWLAVGRRWGRLGLVLAASGVMAWPLVMRPWWLDSAAAGSRPVRMLIFNSSTTAGDAGAALELIVKTDADVVVLTEPSGELLDRIRGSTPISTRYPGFFLPDRAAGGYMLVLSAWPQSPVLGEAPKDVARRGMRVMRIERPEGPFVLVGIHPDSPRSPSEWAKGNGVVEEASVLLRGELIPMGLPVVVGADLNSTPSGWRSRRLCGLGLRRAKPVLAGGTYPAGWPWPLSIAIDDAWVGGCGVVGWETLAGGGSDHRPVLVSLSIPGQGSAPAGR